MCGFGHLHSQASALNIYIDRQQLLQLSLITPAAFPSSPLSLHLSNLHIGGHLILSVPPPPPPPLPISFPLLPQSGCLNHHYTMNQEATKKSKTPALALSTTHATTSTTSTSSLPSFPDVVSSCLATFLLTRDLKQLREASPPAPRDLRWEILSTCTTLV